jgi:hypothetical protein
MIARVFPFLAERRYGRAALGASAGRTAALW